MTDILATELVWSPPLRPNCSSNFVLFFAKIFIYFIFSIFILFQFLIKTFFDIISLMFFYYYFILVFFFFFLQDKCWGREEFSLQKRKLAPGSEKSPLQLIVLQGRTLHLPEAPLKSPPPLSYSHLNRQPSSA